MEDSHVSRQIKQEEFVDDTSVDKNKESVNFEYESVFVKLKVVNDEIHNKLSKFDRDVDPDSKWQANWPEYKVKVETLSNTSYDANCESSEDDLKEFAQVDFKINLDSLNFKLKAEDLSAVDESSNNLPNTSLSTSSSVEVCSTVCEQTEKQAAGTNNISFVESVTKFGQPTFSDQTTNNTEKRFQCPECLKRFAEKRYLTKHLKIHFREKVNHCQYCGKSFESKYLLTCHEKLHFLSDKPYQCQKCRKCYAKKQSLILHECQISRKVFWCIQCGYVVGSKSGLTIHEKSHTGDIPYSCIDCGMQFALKHRLDQHRKLRRCILPMNCQFCKKAFRNKDNFVAHQMIHNINNEMI